ncbi:MAG: B12-binding domain-containing radical SAM protein [Candidatus Hodarchaeota archaeon]
MPEQLRERNVVKKDWRKVHLRVALCYPNAYRVGMTSLAIHLLYHLFNARADVVCERVFYVPGEPPRSLESGQPLSKFDVIAFSLQFETDFVHALEMLYNSGIPLRTDARKRPWVIAGGPCALSNPFPLLPFVNVFQLGDVEPVLDQLLDALIATQKPSDLDTLLDDHFLLAGRTKAQRVWITDLDTAFHPTCQILPVSPYPAELEPTFGESLLVEISRGCDRRCDFCLTTYQCSPRRERSLATLDAIIEGGLQCTGVDKVALLASGFTDHSDLSALLASIVSRNRSLSVPSLRADLPDPQILSLIYQGGQRTLTFAPEAGSERLRTTIGKGIPDDVFHATLNTALAGGFSQIKLYFMIGLPTETPEDILAIETFCRTLLELPPQRHRLHVTIAPFIPKPHTPYQWVGSPSLAALKKRIRLLQGLQRLARIQVDIPNPRWAIIQGALSRGTTELAPVLAGVAQQPKATAGTWFKVAKDQGISLEALATADYSSEAHFPWDRIDVGIKRNILLRRYARLDH